jgi:hypothetical protein
LKDKKTLLSVLFLCAIQVYAQDQPEMREIDSLVSAINMSNLTVQRDTSVLDFPAAKMYTKTYTSVMLDDNELKKYENAVVSLREENGVPLKMDGFNKFYFHKNKLIKVEEYMMDNGKEMHADWYYWNDKSLYYSLKSDKSEERVRFLLALSKSLLKAVKDKLSGNGTL